MSESDHRHLGDTDELRGLEPGMAGDRGTRLRHRTNVASSSGGTVVGVTWSMTSAEFQELVRGGGPRTPDDVTITWDGRRLDTKEKLLDWLREIEPVLAELRARGEILEVPLAR